MTSSSDGLSPDGLERLWTPWRMAYVSGPEKPVGCPFCEDFSGLLVARGELVYAVLNKFPYNPGHLLICPYRHIADYTELFPEEAAELSLFTQRAMTVIRKVSIAHGFNIGINQGSVAGAGIAAHLHQHIVPRWGGDVNFLPVVGNTKALPQLLGDTRDLLRDAWI